MYGQPALVLKAECYPQDVNFQSVIPRRSTSKVCMQPLLGCQVLCIYLKGLPQCSKEEAVYHISCRVRHAHQTTNFPLGNIESFISRSEMTNKSTPN
jgi:hypothetical protein